MESNVNRHQIDKVLELTLRLFVCLFVPCLLLFYVWVYRRFLFYLCVCLFIVLGCVCVCVHARACVNKAERKRHHVTTPVTDWTMEMFVVSVRSFSEAT